MSYDLHEMQRCQRARFALVVAGALSLLAWSAPASARDPAAAEALYRSAKDAAKKGDWERACAQFAESHRLDPAPGTLVNLADCEERRGLIASAWTHYVEVEPQFKPNDARKQLAHDRAAALEKRVPRITINAEQALPADAKVFRDDVELGRASLGVPLPVEPGSHVVVVKVASAEARFPVSVSESSSTDVAVKAPPPPVEAKVPAPKPDPVPRAPSPVTDQRAERGTGTTLGWIFFGAGGVGVAVGAVTGAMALSKASTVKDTCGPDYLTCTADSVDAASSGQSLATVSTVGFIAGGALVAAGLYFILSAPAATKAARSLPFRAGGVGGSF